MRTGAIFARGSCRALKWMALAGMVFALGAGTALAQVTIKVAADGTATATVDDVTVSEARARVSVGVTVEVAADAPAQNNYAIQLSLRAPAATGYAPDLLGEVGGDDADVYWDTISRGTLESAIGTVSWGTRAFAQRVTHEVILGTHQDDDAEDEHYDLGVDFGSGGTVSGTVTWGAAKLKMTDNEIQRFVLRHPLSVTDSTKEGQNVIGIRFEAVPMKTVPFPIRVNLESKNDSQEDYYLTATGENAISQEFMVPANNAGTNQFFDFDFYTESIDGDREDDVVTFKAYLRRGDPTADPPQGNSGARVDTASVQDELDIKVIDQHKLPEIEIEKIEVRDADGKLQEMDYIPEGKIGTVTLTADRGTFDDDVPESEAITVTLTHVDSSTAARADYTLGGTPVKFGATDKTATFTVNVDADEDIGPESLTLLAKVAGEDETYGPNPNDPYNLDPIAFSDATDPKIRARSATEIEAVISAARATGAGNNGRWTPGETMSFEASDFFAWDTAMYNVTLGNSVSDDPKIASTSSSGGSLTITAVKDGMTEISVIGTARATSSSVVTRVPQTVSNEATVRFPVTVQAPAITAKGDAQARQAMVDAAVTKAASESANGIWEPAPNGAVAMIAVSDLFDVPDSINDEYLARSSDPADISVSISADMTMVELTPEGAGTATITVTAVDTDRPGNAVTVDFTATVVEQAAVRALSQAEVDAVFEAASADELVAQGSAISVDMSELFEVGPGVTPRYSAGTSDRDVLDASASGPTLTLTPGQGPAGGMATITVTALDPESNAHADVMYMATVDDLAHVLTITSMPMSGAMVDEGGSITVTATLNQEAPAAMTVELDVSGPASAAEELMIAMGEMSGSATLTVDDDNVVMAMPAIVIVASHAAIAGGSAVLNFSVTEDDVETTYLLAASAEMVEEGGEVTITATTNQAALEDTTIELSQTSGTASDGDYELDSMSITIMMGETTGTATLTATDDYDVEGNETVTLQGAMGNMIVGSVMITIEDNDVETTYTLSASEAMVAEGGTVTITATASQMVRANTEVMVMRDPASTAVAGDYSLEPSMITIMMGETTGTATLTATDDYDVEGNESLMLNGMVGDMAAGSVMVTIEDNDVETTYTLAASAEMVEEGGEVTITATASQMVRANTEVMVMRDGASSAGMEDYSLEPPLITIMAGETEGSLTLTATDDSDVEGNENLTLNGMVGDMAAGSVMLAITDNDMDITYTLSSEDMHIVEGDMDHGNGTKAAATLMATASSAVPMDTEVMVMRDGSSTASDTDFTAESIMIMAGETTGTTMVMAVEDNEPDSGSGSPEMLTLYGMVDGMQTNSVSFHLWDYAVPALPVIAQLLLAAFLAVGGYRRYRRQ